MRFPWRAEAHPKMAEYISARLSSAVYGSAIEGRSLPELQLPLNSKRLGFSKTNKQEKFKEHAMNWVAQIVDCLPPILQVANDPAIRCFFKPLDSQRKALSEIVGPSSLHILLLQYAGNKGVLSGKQRSARIGLSAHARSLFFGGDSGITGLGFPTGPLDQERLGRCAFR